MANQTSDTWSEERVATLMRLWADGLSATRISAAMGLTRNMVIGKVTRLKLPPPAIKQPVVIDRIYTRQLPEITRAKRNEQSSRWHKARRERLKYSIETKREIRERFLSRGASPTSAEYRKHLPPLPEMTKGELRAMLAQAAQNTAAL